MTKILIVDDEQSVRYSFKRFLEASKYKVDEADTGASALTQIKKDRHDLTSGCRICPDWMS
jgi:CheY-like chemotaxis protein